MLFLNFRRQDEAVKSEEDGGDLFEGTISRASAL